MTDHAAVTESQSITDAELHQVETVQLRQAHIQKLAFRGEHTRAERTVEPVGEQSVLVVMLFFWHWRSGLRDPCGTVNPGW